MSNIVKFAMADGISIAVEATGPTPAETGGTVRVARSTEGVVAQTGQTFESAVGTLKPLAAALVDQFRSLVVPPDEAVVEFGFSLKAEVGFIVAGGTSEGNFKVKLTWKKS